MQESKEYKYKFSVVIPIYNVEEYLEETILSIINQDIGFKENIQIILVNDGSPDNSEEICIKYVEKYPKNIKYIKQENKGVSAARNNGMQYIEGKYVNFLDSDDTWNIDVFSLVYDFFENNYEEIDFVAGRLRFFEAQEGFKHPLDYKFDKNKIVNIHIEYNQPQLSASSIFFKKEVLNDNFNEKMTHFEDGVFLNKILLNKGKYAILKDLVYNYRKRLVGTSALQTSNKSMTYYTTTLEDGYKYLVQYSKDKFGKVIPYIQYLIMYDLQWRLKDVNLGIKDDDLKNYKNNIIYLLKNIDDYIILEQRNINFFYKYYCLLLKYERDILSELSIRNNRVFFNNMYLYNLLDKNLFNIAICEIQNNVLKLEGELKYILNDKNYSIYVEDKEKNKYQLTYYDINYRNLKSLDEEFFKSRGFKVEIPLNNENEYRFVLCYKNLFEITLKPKFMPQSKLSGKYNSQYYINYNYILKYYKGIFFVEEKSLKKWFELELEYMKTLFKRKKYVLNIYRTMYYVYGLFIKKPIWIVSDRANKAGDNGEHMFKYLLQNEKNAKIYYTIQKSSPDYRRIKKYGKVLNLNSFKYKMLFLHSSKIISAHADDFVINPLGDKRKYLSDLYKFDYVFLQHGIIKDDLSAWLHKQNKNIKIFVTSVKPEYESVVNGNYAYTEKEIKLTGLPRYDNLLNNNEETKKQIVFMPSWRKNLAGKFNNERTVRLYNENFKDSEYYKFYNTLINDERLLNVMRKHNYTGKFIIHPALYYQSKDFISNDVFLVDNKDTDYQKEFKENKLLITDYSSVFFDFVYLNKPVVYTQFDRESFFGQHIYTEGYFDYERDGFGKVCYDYETTLEEIIRQIENDCVQDEYYSKRRSTFYAYHDTNNCKRVYDEILKLDQNKG